MLPLSFVGITPVELDGLVEGEVWRRWVRSEPALGAVSSLADLHALRGLAADEPLGALVRLAATDGGDDQLAGIAVVHQLQGGVRHLMWALADQSEDIEALVIGALWEKVRTFPWRRRTRAIAANLILDTKTAVMRLLWPGRSRRGVPEPVDVVDFTTWRLDGMSARRELLSGLVEDRDHAKTEVADLLEWARATRLISDEDRNLLLELTQAGHEVADLETPAMLRGVCSETAVLRVAARRGVSSKTIQRRRNRVITTLQDVASRYLSEVA